MIKLIIICLNVSFKKLIIWLQLSLKLIACEYITTGNHWAEQRLLTHVWLPRQPGVGAVKPGWQTGVA